MKESKNLKAHIFVCTNTKEAGASCGPKGAVHLRDELKAMCKNELSAFKGQFRVNASGCLDKCDRGIAAVIYPQSQWFENLKTDDASFLKDQLKKALE